MNPTRLTGADVSADSPRPVTRLRRLALKCLLSIGVFLLLDILVGVTLCCGNQFLGRPLPPYDLTFNEQQERHLKNLGTQTDSYGRFDPDLGWSIRPNGEARNGRFRANSAGFRASREYSAQPPEGVVRICAFGDSYTHGDTVANDETWTHLLEQSTSHIEVLNFGVNGYGTDQAYLRYLRDGAQFHPDIVLIGIMVENILRNVSVYRPAYHHGTDAVAVKPRFRIDEAGELTLVPCPAGSAAELKTQIESGRLLDTLRESDFWVRRASKTYDRSPLFWSSFARLVYAAYEKWHPPERYYADETSEPFQVTARVLTDFHARALADGADRVLVLFFPDETAVKQQLDGGEPYWTTMIAHLTSADVGVLDVTPPLVEAARRDGLNSYFRINHYTPKANALVADVLRNAILKQRATASSP